MQIYGIVLLGGLAECPAKPGTPASELVNAMGGTDQTNKVKPFCQTHLADNEMFNGLIKSLYPGCTIWFVENCD